MTNSQLDKPHVVADVRGYNDPDGTYQVRDAVSFLTDDVPALLAHIKPILAGGGIAVIVMARKRDHLLICRERPSNGFMRLLRAVFTLTRPSKVYRYVEDLPRLDADEKYQSLTYDLPHANLHNEEAVAARVAERERLHAFAARATEVIVYDTVWGRDTVLRPALRELNLI